MFTGITVPREVDCGVAERCSLPDYYEIETRRINFRTPNKPPFTFGEVPLVASLQSHGYVMNFESIRRHTFCHLH